MRDLQPWITLSSKEVLAVPNRLRVVKEQVQLPDGRVVDDFYQIQLSEYVVVFAQTAEGAVVLEQHYKHGPRRVIFSLPAGHLEPEEQPLESAKRELLEETGFEADEWRSLGSFVVSGNQGCGKAHLFKASGAHKIKDPDCNDLEEVEVRLMTPEEVVQAVCNAEVATLASVATIALAMNPQFVKR